MYDYVYVIYAFVKILNGPPVIICLSCHPGHAIYSRMIINVQAKWLHRQRWSI